MHCRLNFRSCIIAITKELMVNAFGTNFMCRLILLKSVLVVKNMKIMVWLSLLLELSQKIWHSQVTYSSPLKDIHSGSMSSDILGPSKFLLQGTVTISYEPVTWVLSILLNEIYYIMGLCQRTNSALFANRLPPTTECWYSESVDSCNLSFLYQHFSSIYTILPPLPNRTVCKLA